MAETNAESSASVFLWKAAISTIDLHPAITANLLLRCKKALSDTKVGIKFRKVSKSSICHSCGNPWSMGKYKLELRKTYKTAKIQKVLMQLKNSKKTSSFNKHILERYSESKSNILIKCGSCFKQTAFPTPLPPNEGKSVKPLSLPTKNQKNKKCKKKKLLPLVIKTTMESNRKSCKQAKPLPRQAR